MIRAVFDTNVFISALFNPQSPPAKLLDLALQGKIKLITSPQLIGEIERVLTYPRVQRLLQKRKTAPGEIGGVLASIIKIAVLTPGNLIIEVIPDDPEDDMVISCALEGRADFIVSGDHHLLHLRTYQGIEIVPPAELWTIIDRDKNKI